ncbi:MULTISPECIES: nucleotide sugar dehydrogenase [unclassified Sphingomonas]|uniref:nucleotide sugar dehydrogenase n=1 Tax=unclassified Sphingomonas TaxID=196159 RepID=UPI000AD2ED27|nr:MULTISPECIES: nucleotide sugar dehydrogenase [unclassified Sphingomonas]
MSRIAVIGLGYVGLPLAAALARHFPTVGIDIDQGRVDELRRGHDRTNELTAEALAASSLALATDIGEAADADVVIVTVPTPVDHANRPDLGPVMSATRAVASVLKPGRGTIIVYESTVYPGVTEDLCGPELEKLSGLRRGTDFFLGYSPERINPGDREHTVDRITKVVAGENPAVLDTLCAMYGAITTGGTFRAASIKVAEAAKVIENAQRDINIAFVNEITQIFGKVGISIWDVLAAAGTKWNFLRFVPGLVGGHCIGVDPYYLSYLAQQLGHYPRVILAGRGINDGMGAWIADQIHEKVASGSRILVLGLTFKENVPDLRNSRVIDVVRRLEWLRHEVVIHDPLADPVEARHEYGVDLAGDALDTRYDVVIGAVSHADYAGIAADRLAGLVKEDGLVADLKGMWSKLDLPAHVRRWSL